MIRRLRTDDRGTSLLIVLMIITFVSVVMGAILSQEDTSVKATVALQDQAATNYGADAAGQAVVTQLKNGQFACTATSPSTLNLGSAAYPFYAAAGSAPQNAVASCTPDTTTGVTTTVTGTGTMVGAANTPTASLTTVGTTVADGIFAGTVSVPFTVCVQGSVVSYTTITGILSAGQNTNGSATACPNATTSSITVQAYGSPLANLIVPGTGCKIGYFPVTPCTGLGSSVPAVPTVPDPVATSTASNPPAVCTSSVGGKVYAAFVPGIYTVPTSSTSAFSLANPCPNGKKWAAADVYWFSPGVYYFNFPGATTWTLPATVVGGTPANSSGQPIAGLNPTNASTLANLAQMPTGEGKCIPPTAQTQPNEGGVEFVFGGASTMTGMTPSVSVSFPSLKTVVGPSTDLDLCATYSPTSSPVAIYGVQHPLTVATSPSATTIPVESGCVASPLCAIGSNSILNWPTALAVFSPDQTFHIDGYVWAPAAAMVITYANSNGQAFNWGVLVRSFQLIGQNSLTMVRTPPPSPGQVTSYSYSVRYVNVWTCAASANPCPPSGSPDVQIKLQQTGSTWKVLSWSEQR